MLHKELLQWDIRKLFLIHPNIEIDFTVKDESKIIDWRSTGRRIGRRALYNARVEYKCDTCNKTTIEPPKDAPKFFDDIWPTEIRVLESQLQVQHISKDPSINDLAFIKWLCASCHKNEDLTTEKGVAVETIDFGL